MSNRRRAKASSKNRGYKGFYDTLKQATMGYFREVMTKAKEIVDGAVGGKEALRMAS